MLFCRVLCCFSDDILIRSVLLLATAVNILVHLIIIPVILNLVVSPSPEDCVVLYQSNFLDSISISNSSINIGKTVYSLRAKRRVQQKRENSNRAHCATIWCIRPPRPSGNGMLTLKFSGQDFFSLRQPCVCKGLVITSRDLMLSRVDNPSPLWIDSSQNRHLRKEYLSKHRI